MLQGDQQKGTLLLNHVRALASLRPYDDTQAIAKALSAVRERMQCEQATAPPAWGTTPQQRQALCEIVAPVTSAPAPVTLTNSLRKKVRPASGGQDDDDDDD